MKSYTIEELSELYKKKNESTHEVDDQANVLFKNVSSQKLEPKTLNESKEHSLDLSGQLNISLEEDNNLKSTNPLEEIFNECVGSYRDQHIQKENIISSKSRKIGKLLRDQQLFDQEIRKPTSILYDVVIFDLLELNTEKSEKVLSNSEYSEKINDYFRLKTGQYLFDSSDKNHKNFTKFINNDKFFKYYEYGYHSKETEKSFDLKIDKNFLNMFKEIVHNNLKSNNFNLLSEKICESPNNYEIVDSIHDRQLMKKKTRTL